MRTMSTATSDLSRLFEKQISEQDLELPMMPGTAAEVMALCQQDTTDAAKLSAVIHRDQTIASNVLRVANSAAFGGQVGCASLQQAVSRLGMRHITEIAVAVSVRARLFANPVCAELLQSLWRHAVLAGFFTKEIARVRRRNVEIAFLCGLLHDIGKAVLLNNVDRATGRTGTVLPVAYLAAALHEQHVAAGSLLARQWRLPEQIEEAIRWHHEPAAATRFQEMTMTVCLADELAHAVAPSRLAPVRTEVDLRAHPVLAALNVYPDQLGTLLAMKDRGLSVAEGMA
jgi:putative nucleotidyltransferase with HDIG domain